jgi:hypothetical protein
MGVTKMILEYELMGTLPEFDDEFIDAMILEYELMGTLPEFDYEFIDALSLVYVPVEV